MKKYFFVLSLFCGLALSLTSCGDDDDELNGSTQSSQNSQNSQNANIIDSGKYGKFEKLTINEIPVYNCIEAVMGSFSTYEFKPEYLTWRNNGYEYEPAVCIDLTMYDAPTIEASGLADITLFLKESAIKDETLKGGAVDVTSKLLAIYVDVLSKTEFRYGADYQEKFSVLAGGIKLKKKKDKEYSVTFDNFKVKIEKNEVSINGTASFEESHLSN